MSSMPQLPHCKRKVGSEAPTFGDRYRTIATLNVSMRRKAHMTVSIEEVTARLNWVYSCVHQATPVYR
jgi:hypothetical protein